MATTNGLPEALTTHPYWLPHKNKIPAIVKKTFNTNGLQYIKWSDLKNSLSYESALQNYKDNPNLLSGIGIILPPPYIKPTLVCIDIDKIKEKTDAERLLLKKIILLYKTTYTEYSPSGNGLHIWFKLPQTGDQPFIKNIKHPIIELYTNSHFITVTHNKHPDSPLTLATITEAMLDMVEEAIRETYDQNQPSNQPSNQTPQPTPPPKPSQPQNDYYKLPTEPVTEGHRNNALTSYLGHLIKKDAYGDQALTAKTLLEKAVWFNLTYLDPPLDTQELQRTTSSMWRKATQDRASANTPSTSPKYQQAIQPQSKTSQLRQKPSTERTAEEALQMLISDYIYVNSDDRYYNLKTGSTLSQSALNTSFGLWFNGTKNSPYAHIVHKSHPDRLEADDYGWMPYPYDQPEYAHIYSPRNKEHKRLVNTFSYPIPPSHSATDPTYTHPAPWLELIDHLIPEPHYRTALILYFALAIQQPHIKQSWHPIIFGAYGAGKDSLLTPLMRILPSATITDRDIRGQYDNHLLQRKLIVINESKLTRDCMAFYKLNGAPEASGERELNIKGKNKVTQVDCCNLVVLSNHWDAAALDKNERRALVLHTPNKMPLPLIDRYYAWLATPNAIPSLFRYLLDLDLSQPPYDTIPRHETPYRTAYMAAMVNIAQPEDEADAQAILDDWPYDIISLHMLSRMTPNRDLHRSVALKTLIEAKWELWNDGVRPINARNPKRAPHGQWYVKPTAPHLPSGEMNDLAVAVYEAYVKDQHTNSKY